MIDIALLRETPDLLAESLRAVVSQRLVPTADGHGRVPALEILINNKAIGNLIRDNKTYRITSSIQTGYKHGMRLMDDSLFKLWRDEKVTIEDVLLKAQSPDDLAKRIANAQRGVFDDEADVEDAVTT